MSVIVLTKEVEDEPNEITKEQAKEMFPWIEEIVTLRKLDHIYVSDDFADALESKGWDSGYDAGMMGARWDKGEYTAIYEDRYLALDGSKNLSWAENSISDLKRASLTVREQIAGTSPGHILLWKCSGCSFDDTPTKRSIIIYVSQKEVRKW